MKDSDREPSSSDFAVDFRDSSIYSTSSWIPGDPRKRKTESFLRNDSNTLVKEINVRRNKCPFFNSAYIFEDKFT